jgi:hypothetical protein
MNNKYSEGNVNFVNGRCEFCRKDFLDVVGHEALCEESPFAPKKERTDLEPPGGNLYRPHYLQIDSGTFWRCAHGHTGIGEDVHSAICWECTAQEPKRAIKWHGKKDFGKALKSLYEKSNTAK